MPANSLAKQNLGTHFAFPRGSVAASPGVRIHDMGTGLKKRTTTTRIRHFVGPIFQLGILLFSCTLLLASAVAIPHGTAELLTERTSIQPGHHFYIGLNFRLEPGWHIYWINPGDAGESPRVTWQLPAGVHASTIEWPMPKRLPAFTLMDFGYEDQVLLLVPMKASPKLDAGSSLSLSAGIKLAVCRDVCVTGRAQASLSLPVRKETPPPDEAASGLFRAARRALPQPMPPSWKFKVVSRKDSFQLAGSVGHSVQQAFFFPLLANQIENAAPQTLRPVKSGFELTLKKSDQFLKPIDRLQGALLLGEKAYSLNIPVH